jgi:hypothetical protein
VSQRRGSRAPRAVDALSLLLIAHLLAAREWRHAVSGGLIRVGVSTFERWYYRARKERHDPVGVLRRKPRSDAGQQAPMSAACGGPH